MSTLSARSPSLTTARQRWGRSYGGYYSNLFVLWIGSRFLWLGYALIWMAAGFYFVIAGKARRASMRYLDRLYPGRRFLRRWWETYRHMTEFGYLLLDRALMLASENHGYSMTFQGHERLIEAQSESRGIVLLTAHFGNAEIAVPYLEKYGLTRPFHMVMYREESDPTEAFHARHRRLTSAMDLISTTDPLDAGIRIMRALRDGDMVALRADRIMDGKVVDVMLLGERVKFPAGPFLATELSGAPVFYVYTCRLGYRKYMCTIHEPNSYSQDTSSRNERLERAAQDFATDLEGMLRRFPRHWSNFYDFWAQRPEQTDEVRITPQPV